MNRVILKDQRNSLRIIYVINIFSLAFSLNDFLPNSDTLTFWKTWYPQVIWPNFYRNRRNEDNEDNVGFNTFSTKGGVKLLTLRTPENIIYLSKFRFNLLDFQESYFLSLLCRIMFGKYYKFGFVGLLWIRHRVC